MKKIGVLLGIIFINYFNSFSQNISGNTVGYMVNYEATSSNYTVWLVPSYNTPNSNNTDSDEKAITAQVSLKVPKNFLITDIQNIHGSWDGSAMKLGQQDIFNNLGLDPLFEYYVIGKSPQETNLGPLVKNVPVALFTFKGNVKNASLNILEKTDKFVAVAYTNFALSVQPSFYSKSGQKAVAGVVPLEQFLKGISEAELKSGVNWNSDQVLLANESTLLVNESTIYPNPLHNTELYIKYFVKIETGQIQATISSNAGNIIKSEALTTDKLGWNVFKINCTGFSNGIYYLKLESAEKVNSHKFAIQRDAI